MALVAVRGPHCDSCLRLGGSIPAHAHSLDRISFLSPLRQMFNEKADGCVKVLLLLPGRGSAAVPEA